MSRLLALLTAVRRRLLIHRRGLAALCLGVAVWSTLHVIAADPAPTVPAWTAARDLASGTVLRAADFRRTGFRPGTLPDAAAANLSQLVGRTLVTPLDKGQVATSDAVLRADRLAAYPGRAAIAVRISDPDAAGLLQHGDVIGLISSDPQGARAPEEITADATVLAVPPSTAGGAGQPGRLVVLAVPAAQAPAIAAAATNRYLTVVWSR
jgi:pilus assembly protein CpaB